MPDNEDITVTTVQKNQNVQIRILVVDFKKNTYIHIREFFRRSESEDWQYGKGVTFPYDNIDILDALISGLQRIKKALEKGEPLTD